MTVERIAYLLTRTCCWYKDSAKQEIIPDNLWCEESEALLDKAFANAGKLQRQRDELDLLLPGFRDKHHMQFKGAVREIAGKLYEELYPHECW